VSRLLIDGGLVVFLSTGKVKGNIYPRTGYEDTEGKTMRSSTIPSTLALDGDVWSTPRPGCFTRGKDPVPIILEAGWTPGTVWTGAENLAHTEFQTPDYPARSESLYLLSYPGPLVFLIRRRFLWSADSCSMIRLSLRSGWS